MPAYDPDAPDAPDDFTPYVVGFAGVLAVFLFLPRTLKFFLRRFIFGLISEVVLVVLAGLLTEKAVEKLTDGPR